MSGMTTKVTATSDGDCYVGFLNKSMAICYWNSLNFGDEIGPVVAKKLLEAHFGCSASKVPLVNLFDDYEAKKRKACLFVLGSVFHIVKSGDHIWGIGANPNYHHHRPIPSQLTFHSVRGPLTSGYILDKIGGDEYTNQTFQYGDRGLLLPSLFNLRRRKESSRICFVAHKNDLGHKFLRNPPTNVHVISCHQHWESAVEQIRSCGYVASSSLHGVIVADALGIPRLWFQFNDTRTVESEGSFKYLDYFKTIGQTEDIEPIRNSSEINNTENYAKGLDPSELAAAIVKTSASFPYELFETIKRPK
mmetsp:Transcript_2509/g.5831  ORF Transcript_2509/g.5831 Transcript_2509/m.5831 type:complete len:305 (-) Transcript_2509:1616-2530(-)